MTHTHLHTLARKVLAAPLALSAMVLSTPCAAQNPIICDRYTPDPAPYVHGDTLYLFVDHDGNEDTGYFNMPDWLLYSTVNMVNWTYRGTPVTTATFSKWAKQGNDAWAAQCVERGGKWYWFVTATVEGRGYPGIGVAVADNPDGPYKDLLGKPIAEGWFYIDPTVFIDNDGQAYLFWGNNNLWYGKLSKSMKTLSNITKVDTNDQSAFGPYKGYDDNGNPKTNYEEAPWIYRIDDTYYLEYAAGGVPEHWAYSTAKDINGPWTYQGRIMGQADGSFTIHGGSVDYRGHSYMFYHNGKLPGGGGFKRATCIEEFTRRADGRIDSIPFTTKGVAQLQYVDPYQLQQAETINQSSGILCQGDRQCAYVTNIKKDSWFSVRGVDFGADTIAATFTVRLAAPHSATMYVRLDRQNGPIMASVKVPDTGGLDQWQDIEVDLRRVPTGVHDLYFTFNGSLSAGNTTLLNINTWRVGTVPTPVRAPQAATATAAPAYHLDGTPATANTPGRVVIRNRRKVLTPR